MRNSPKNCILLGNGIHRCFGGEGWTKFLESITTEAMKELLLSRANEIVPSLEESIDLEKLLENIKCPAPLLATLLTEDSLDVSLRKKANQYLAGTEDGTAWSISITNSERNLLQALLELEIEDIFTTNYTYELEMADIYPVQFTRTMRKKMQEHTATVSRAENKYLYHTYNCLKNAKKRVWHIHGEMDKPDSMILGHYYYSKNIHNMENQLEKEPIKPDNLEGDKESWLKMFLTANVFCIGFSCDLSEHDMWWLLNRKAREKENCGKVYFYAPKSKGFDTKIELMRVMKNVTTSEPLFEIIDFNRVNSDNFNWEEFYYMALEDIRERIATQKQTINETERELLFV